MKLYTVVWQRDRHTVNWGSTWDKMRIAAVIITVLVLLIILPIAIGGWFSGHDSVSSSVCTDCHQLDEIGILTTTGIPISQEYAWQSQLHQALSNPDCLACHTGSDNQPQPFQHGLLNASINNKCALCHIDSIPNDAFHLSAGTGCGECHSPPTWASSSFEHDQYFSFDSNHTSICSNCHLIAGDFSQYSCTGCHQLDEIGILTTTGIPISQEYAWQSQLHQALSNPDCLACHTGNDNEQQPFDHGLLNTPINNQCALCHKDLAPNDEIHLSAGDSCSNCHSPTSWSNVSFEHSQYFVFDRHHPPTCSNCHLVPGDYSQYSCAKCHDSEHGD